MRRAEPVVGFNEDRIRTRARIGLMHPRDQGGDLFRGETVEGLAGHLLIPGLVAVADREFGQLIQIRRPVGIE